VREIRASGLESLALATQLLQRCRLADPEVGLWEAADVQWWWRKPRASDTADEVFWVDDEGPLAGVLLTDWGRAWGCDPIVVPGAGMPLETVWSRAVESIEPLEAVEILVGDDDIELLDLVAASGFVADHERSGICWMDLASRPAVRAVPEGFAIVDRTNATTPHPLRERNGDGVEARLPQCSLYNPALDLGIETMDGETAGVVLFWADHVTKVGLLEPMRVKESFQRRGLASALIAEGVDRLARRGIERAKVGYSTDIARALYIAAGFRVTSTNRAYSLKRY
jgi:ribosomal protein S18 acetylase RimI-like enzyme